MSPIVSSPISTYILMAAAWRLDSLKRSVAQHAHTEIVLP